MPRLQLGVGRDGQPVGAFNVGHATDDSLRRLRKGHLRDLEDIADGDSNRSERTIRSFLRDVETEIELREALAEVWAADEWGTDSYTDFMARGGISATFVCGGLRPSYRLAIFLDRWNFLVGKPSALDWQGDRLEERPAHSLISAECPRCGYDHFEDILDRPMAVAG